MAKLNPAGSALVYSTYLGGSGSDDGPWHRRGLGRQRLRDRLHRFDQLPDRQPLPDQSLGGGTDAFVAKLNPAGSALVYSTYLGGSSLDYGNGIAVDAAGDAYVTGVTTSTNFPTANPFQATNPGGVQDAFVTKLNPAGSALVYSTYLGGTGDEIGNGIAVDSAGDAYVTGDTTSTNFPTTLGAYQTTLEGTQDAFVTHLKFDGIGAGLFHLAGGNGTTTANGIAVDSRPRLCRGRHHFDQLPDDDGGASRRPTAAATKTLS